MRKSVFLLLFLFAGSLLAQDVGTQAPEFSHVTLDHGNISLSNFSGKVVYLFFFEWN